MTDKIIKKVSYSSPSTAKGGLHIRTSPFVSRDHLTQAIMKDQDYLNLARPFKLDLLPVDLICGMGKVFTIGVVVSPADRNAAAACFHMKYNNTDTPKPSGVKYRFIDLKTEASTAKQRK